jgi:hypothetical protein
MARVSVKVGERRVVPSEDLRAHLSRGDKIRIEFADGPEYMISYHPDDAFESTVITLDRPFRRWLPGVDEQQLLHQRHLQQQQFSKEMEEAAQEGAMRAEATKRMAAEKEREGRKKGKGKGREKEKEGPNDKEAGKARDESPKKVCMPCVCEESSDDPPTVRRLLVLWEACLTVVSLNPHPYLTLNRTSHARRLSSRPLRLWCCRHPTRRATPPRPVRPSSRSRTRPWRRAGRC